jgi:predicted Rossmann fold nucleotide-binding protein DprA/Smf involved in DNA uptake
MNQLEIDWTRRVRLTDPDTSVQAAKRAKSLSSDHAIKILAALQQGAGTFYEIADRSGLRPDQVWRRLGELERQGLARTIGEPRPGPSGRFCRVWEAL